MRCPLPVDIPLLTLPSAFALAGLLALDKAGRFHPDLDSFPCVITRAQLLLASRARRRAGALPVRGGACDSTSVGTTARHRTVHREGGDMVRVARGRARRLPTG